MERKWGCGRLRLLVGAELREKFDRQRYMLQYAILKGELIEVQTQAQRMVNAWRALDRAAEAAGAVPLAPEVWEACTDDGVVVAIVKTMAEAHRVVADWHRDRPVVVYSLDEVARILATQTVVLEIKKQWPGAFVTRVSTNVSDPLDGVEGSADLNDPIDDLFVPTGV